MIYCRELNQDDQTKYVITQFIKDTGCSFGDAAKIWYNSKTKNRLHCSEKDYSLVSPKRCYQELQYELNKDPRWMTTKLKESHFKDGINR